MSTWVRFDGGTTMEGVNVSVMGDDVVPPEKANVDLNTPPAAEKDGEPQQSVPSSIPDPVPYKQRYGTWMLVSRKPKLVDHRKNHHQNKHKKSAPRKDNNRFAALGGEPESVEVPRKTKTKGKKPKEHGESSKGKSPNLSNSFQNPQPPPPVRQVVNTTSNHTTATANGKGRGGTKPAVRNRGREAGRKDPTNRGSTPLPSGWFSNLKTTGLFQFGESHRPSEDLSTGNQRTFNVVEGNSVALRVRRKLRFLDRASVMESKEVEKTKADPMAALRHPPSGKR
nr:LINE-type retrotransposon LIb DNA [Ipomoea batatas]